MARTPKRQRPNNLETRTEFTTYRLSNRVGASRLVHRLRVGLALLVVVSASNAPGTLSAQPDSDRSLNADNKPATAAADNAAPVVDASAAAPKTGAGDTNAPPDLSGLTREQLEAKTKSLMDNLAAANTESEYFREQWTELKLRDEALGVEALTVDESKMEDKLVQAVKELYQSEMKRREALVLLDKLLSTSDQLLQTAPNFDPKIRADYEIATRSAKAYMAGHSGAAIPLGVTLADARVADANPDLNSVVLNVGRNQGVKEGMPFLIYEDTTEVGTVKVVLARDLVCAAQVESVRPNKLIRVGDLAKVQTQ
jgi:hypothetical protein